MINEENMFYLQECIGGSMDVLCCCLRLKWMT